MGNEIFEKKEPINSRPFKWTRYAVLIALIVNLIFYGLFHYSAIYEFKQVGEALTNEVSQSIRIWMGEQRKIASLLTVAPSLQEWMIHTDSVRARNEANRYLRSVATRFNQYESIRLDVLNNPEKPWRDIDSNVLALDSQVVSVGQSDAKALLENNWLDQILSGKSYYISGIFKSEDTGKPVFYYSMPIIRNNQVQGILSFKVKMSYYTDLIFKNAGYKHSGYLFMIDADGETIAHVNQNYILSDEQYLIDIVNRILMPLKLGDNFFSGKFQGAKKFYYGTDSGLSSDHIENQWYIMFTQKETEVYTQASRFLMVMLISTGILLGVLGVSYRRFSKVKGDFYEASLNQIQQENLREQLAMKKNEMLKQISIDQLTGVGHFQTLMRALEQQVALRKNKAESSTLCLMLCQIDDFGSFNENEGFELGDVLLNFLGKNLGEFFQEPYQVGRVCGDVFAILLPQKTLIESVVLAEQFRDQYDKKRLTLIPHKPSLSLGIVQWDQESHGELFRKAEQVLLKCKKEGPNQIKY